ncbi:radical SAM protein [Marispirochaeta aestuarii]|uniref:radical SAM protein n=1 Tax=Marispirochaeta aestuarii TaxID=1963862 RepID=UPI0029C93284|nr:radical SAM protein [Marispirochaeta aestuarii]
MSLGIDLVPHKVCTFNCIYCECGITTKLTLERREYIPADDVLSELSGFLRDNPKPDYLTFSGAGEPTLNSGIGRVLAAIKRCYPDIPVAVLTNGSLFSDPVVREELLPADLVLPSLDAASEKTFCRIDRPHRRLDLNACIQGLADFRREYSGKIWLEVMILPGYNDNRKELALLKKAILRIGPERVQLNTLDRPGAVKNLQAADDQTLRTIIEYWGLDNVEIIAAPQVRKKTRAYRTDMESAILETLKRRPCTLPDLVRILVVHENELNKYLGVLEAAGRIEAVSERRGIFYRYCGRPA